MKEFEEDKPRTWYSWNQVILLGIYKKYQKNIQEDMLKMMEKLNLGKNNETFFNPIHNLGNNQIRG